MLCCVLHKGTCLLHYYSVFSIEERVEVAGEARGRQEERGKWWVEGRREEEMSRRKTLHCLPGCLPDMPEALWSERERMRQKKRINLNEEEAPWSPAGFVPILLLHDSLCKCGWVSMTAGWRLKQGCYMTYYFPSWLFYKNLQPPH